MMSSLLLSTLLAPFSVDGAALNVDSLRELDAYEAAGVVTIDPRSMASLSDQQLRALLEFAGACGRVLLVDMPGAAQRVFRQRAACGGRYLLAATAGDDLPALQRGLRNMPEPERASTAQMVQLLEGMTSRSLEPVRLALFLGAYLLVMILLLLRPQTRLAALGFSVLAAVLAHVLWPPASVRTLVAWAEADLTDRVAAYEALRRTRTYRDGTYSRDEERSRGSFAVNPSVEVALMQEAIVLCNAGPGPSMTTHLFHLADVYALPELAPGDRWTTTGASPVNPATPGLALFEARSAKHDVTLLQPLPVPDSSGSAWLLLSVQPAQGKTSCDQ
jgi:hypothetical protein